MGPARLLVTPLPLEVWVPWGLPGCLCSALSAVETSEASWCGRWARIPCEAGEPLFLIHSTLVCFALWLLLVSGLATCGPHHSWEPECRAVVPAQTAQTPQKFCWPLPHTSWNWNFGSWAKEFVSMRSLDDSSGLRNHWPRPARVKLRSTLWPSAYLGVTETASTAPSTPGTQCLRAHWWWLLILFQFFKLPCHDPLNWFPSPLLGYNP